METKYIPDTDFVVFVKQQGDKAALKNIDGHFRWVINDEYIVRPESSKP